VFQQGLPTHPLCPGVVTTGPIGITGGITGGIGATGITGKAGTVGSGGGVTGCGIGAGCGPARAGVSAARGAGTTVGIGTFGVKNTSTSVGPGEGPAAVAGRANNLASRLVAIRFSVAATITWTAALASSAADCAATCNWVLPGLAAAAACARWAEASTMAALAAVSTVTGALFGKATERKAAISAWIAAGAAASGIGVGCPDRRLIT
jgi:hypothetical protein